MKIAIDCRFWGPRDTGLGVYTRNLVENLSQIDRVNEYYLLLRTITFDELNLPANFHKIKVEAKAYSLVEQVKVALELYQLHPDLVHFVSINIPILYFGKYVITVHDLIKHFSRGTSTSTHSPFLYWLKYTVYLFVTWLGVNFSRKIIVPSHSVKNLIVEKYKVDPSKIVCIYEAAAITPHTKAEKITLPDRFALYVGNAYPHKNLVNLITAWERVYRQTKTKLVLVCGRSVFAKHFEDLIAKKPSADYISFLGSISDAELSFAHQHAQIYVFPSLMEGFGIPGLDAMSLGLPVACSDIPVLREIYGSAAMYFNPSDPADITDRCIELITDKSLHQKMRQLGIVQSQKYSWAKLARETKSVYESCFSLRSGQ